MLNAWPGSSGSRLPDDEVRVLVRLEPDAVPGAVDEAVAEPAGGDDAARGGVDLLARRADGRGAHRLLLRVDEQRVDVAHLGASARPTTNMRVMSEQ